MSRQQSLYFDFARSGQRITPVWWAIPIAILIFFAGQMIGGIVFGIAYVSNMVVQQGIEDPSELDPEALQFDMASFSSVTQGGLLISTFILVALFVFIWIAIYEKRSIVSLGFHSFGGGLLKFIRGGIFGFVSMAVIAYGMQAAGYAENTGISTPPSWLMVWPILILMLGWIVQGSTEEILARGLLFQSIGARHGLIIGVLVSTIIFTVGHGMNSNPSALFFANLALYSVFACLYALREGSLWGICGHHAMWNFAQGNIFGFAVSGERFGADQLMQFSSTGPTLITGGATGPEGGLVTTVILGVSMLILLMISPAKALYDKRPAPATDT